MDGAALVVANVVGAGIFLTPGIIAGMVPAPLPFLGVWLLGGVLALLGALSYAELATRRPRAGGEYVYISEAFGPLAGFLSGWTSFVAGFSGAIAAAAIGFAEYLGRLSPPAADTQPWLEVSLGVWTLGLSPRSLVAVLVIVFFTLVLFSGAAVAGLFVLRHRDSGVPRPYAAWGYPVAPAVFVLMSAAMVVQAIRNAPGPSLSGLLIITAGVPIYFGLLLGRRSKKPTE